MDPVVILASVFAIFIPALILPGPDFVAVVRSSMTRGTVAGMKTAAGVSLMLSVYAALSLLGLSAILTQYQWLAWVVRILGGAYLAYLGIRLILARREEIDIDEQDGDRPGSPFMFGMLVTLTNPKAIVLFASVFATAVTGETPVWLMALMVAIVFTASMGWYAVVSMFMSSAPIIRSFGHMRHAIERAAGVCFVAIGGKLIADSRNPLTP